MGREVKRIWDMGEGSSDQNIMYKFPIQKIIELFHHQTQNFQNILWAMVGAEIFHTENLNLVKTCCHKGLSMDWREGSVVTSVCYSST